MSALHFECIAFNFSVSKSQCKQNQFWLPFSTSKLPVKMRFICRNQTYQKQFSIKFNRSKHERIKGHFEESKPATRKIPHDPLTNLFFCPTIGCKITSKCKQNVLKHLKSCSQVNVNRATAEENRTCRICNKTFAKKSN